MLALAVSFLYVAAAFQLMDGMQVTAAMSLRGLKDTRGPMWLAGASYWLAGAPMCGPHIVYVTASPSSKEGTLYSTIEVWEEEFLIHGVTGVVSTNRGEAPEIELSQLGC